MADSVTSDYRGVLMREMLGVLTRNFASRSVLLNQLKRQTNQRHFHGDSVRFGIILNRKQGTGSVAEDALYNAARKVNKTKASLDMATVTHAIAMSAELLNDMDGSQDVAFADALKLEMQLAEEAMPAVENEFLNGDGTGLLAAVTAAGTASTTVTVGTAANFDLLYPGRIIDIAVRTTGALIASGGGLTIEDVNETAGTITVDTAVTTATTNGVYIEGSPAMIAATAQQMQGIQQVRSDTGTFEGIDRSTTAGWRGVDGRGGVTTAVDLDETVLDGAERRVGANSDGPSFYIGDVAVIDKYSEGLQSQRRWDGAQGELATGITGVKYRNKLLIPERAHPRGAVTGVHVPSLTFYARQNGPDWDRVNGGMWKEFERKRVREAVLVDSVQLAATRCNTCVRVDNLNRAL